MSASEHRRQAAHEYPTLNKDERNKVASLMRRRDYLTELVAAGHANDWDRAEVASLVWTLAYIKRVEMLRP